MSAPLEEITAALRDARAKARAHRQRGRVLQRDGRMPEAMQAFREAEAWQERAERLEHERTFTRHRA